jgi:hypothetical protein
VSGKCLNFNANNNNIEMEGCNLDWATVVWNWYGKMLAPSFCSSITLTLTLP